MTQHGAGGRKEYVSCAEDNCNECDHDHRCLDTGCSSCKDRHFIMVWDDPSFKVNEQRVGETEYVERLEEGVDKVVEKRKKEGF